MTELSIKIKTMRKSRGMTQTDLAAACGISRSTISMYELGTREPDLDTIETLADVFNVPMSALVDRSDTPTPRDERIRQAADLFAQLTPENQQLASDFLSMLLNKQ